MLCFLCIFFLIIIIIFLLIYVSLLLYLFQSTSLLIYNSPRSPYSSMNSWKYCMKTLTPIDSRCKIQPRCNWWAFVNGIAVLYTVVYRIFVENQPNKWKYIHKTWHPLGLSYMYFFIGNPSLNDIISPPMKHSSVYILWFCICSSCWQYVSDFHYHDCHGLNAGRSVDSLKKQKHSGILVARYPRIYKEIITCNPDTNLKAKPNRNTLRFRLHRYHVPVDATMISFALPISFWRRELRYQDRTDELPRSSVFFFNLLQFCQILSQIRISHRNNN